MKPNTIAMTVSLVTGLLLVLGLWIAPAALTPPEREASIGPHEVSDLPLTSQAARTFRWEYRITLEDPHDVDVWFSLPWDINITTPYQSGLAFHLAICAYVNGELVRPDPPPIDQCSTVSAQSGRSSSRGAPEKLPREAFHVGSNEVRIEATARADPPAPESRVHLEIGPVRSATQAKDTNRDGIADSYQFIPVLHGGAVALVAATAIAAITYPITRRLVRDRKAPLEETS